MLRVEKSGADRLYHGNNFGKVCYPNWIYHNYAPIALNTAPISLQLNERYTTNFSTYLVFLQHECSCGAAILHPYKRSISSNQVASSDKNITVCS